MKRTLLVLGMVLALAMTAMADAEPEYPEPGITSPTAGEVIYENTLYLEALASADVSVNVAVRTTTENDNNCSLGGETVIYRDVSGDLGTDGEGVYSESIDISEADAGLYCFAFDPADAPRTSSKFWIVDDYAKVGGVIDLSDGKPSKGNGTHAMEGVVGIAGTYGTVGSVTINYRELGEVCTFTPGVFSLDDAPGIGVLDFLRGDLDGFNNSCGGTARLLVLDRDASEDYPRGAIYVDQAMPGYGIDIDSNDSSGFGNWVPMLKGNNHVGTR